MLSAKQPKSKEVSQEAQGCPLLDVAGQHQQDTYIIASSQTNRMVTVEGQAQTSKKGRCDHRENKHKSIFGKSWQQKRTM
jgi:hypothetical protein